MEFPPPPALNFDQDYPPMILSYDSSMSSISTIPSQGSVDSTASNFVREELLDIWPDKCAYVIEEILQTEEAYVKALADIVKGYMNPLLYIQSTEEGERFVMTVFGNIDRIHNMHLAFQRDLTMSSLDPHEFGVVFISYREQFDVYTQYCMNYTMAIACLNQELQRNKELQQIIMKYQRSLCHALPLHSQLIKPVQRILKYRLLLKELLKHFNPEHYGYPSLDKALVTMAAIAENINEVKKKEENAMRVKDIQSSLSGWSGKAAKNLSAYGNLLHDETCWVGKKGAEREVLLFDNLLLILKKKDTKRYVYKGHLLAEELSVADVPRESPSFSVFSRLHRHQTYRIQARSAKAQEEWVRKIQLLASRKLEEVVEEEEYEQQVKRRRVGSDATHPQAAEKSLELQHVVTTKSGRVRRSRKRKDVLSVFGREVEHRKEEGQPELISVKKLQTFVPEDNITHDLWQQEAPMQTEKLKGMDSPLSLSDVEFTEEGEEQQEIFFRFTEEIDAPVDSRDQHKGPTRKGSQLQRKAAIRVTRKALNNSAKQNKASMLKAKARLAREASRTGKPDKWPPKRRTTVSSSEEEGDNVPDSPLLSIIGSKKDDGSSMSEPQLDTSLSGQAGDGVEEVNVVTDGRDESPRGRISTASSFDYQDLGPPIEIILEENQEGVFEIDRSQATAKPPAVEGNDDADQSEEEEIMIVEGSSDTEDEEEEETAAENEGLEPSEQLSISITQAGQLASEGSVVPPERNWDISLNTSDEVSVQSGDLAQFFETLSRGATPEPGEKPLLGEVNEDVPQQNGGHDIFQFKGVADTFATMPRKVRPRGPLQPSLTMSTPNKLCQSPAAARKAGFSRLLEFTRQHSSPMKQQSVDMSQSLPVTRRQLYKSFSVDSDVGDHDVSFGGEKSSLLSLSFPTTDLHQIQEQELSDVQPEEFLEDLDDFLKEEENEEQPSETEMHTEILLQDQPPIPAEEERVSSEAVGVGVLTSKPGVPFEEQVGIPMTDLEQTVAPISDQERISMPASNQEHISMPAGNQEHISMPASNQEHISMPASHQEHISMPASNQEHISMPASNQEHISMPASNQEHISMPASHQEHISMPASNQEHISMPASTQEHISMPASNQEHISMPASNQEHISMPASNQEHISMPASNQEHIAVPMNMQKEVSTSNQEETVAPANAQEQTVGAMRKKELAKVASLTSQLSFDTTTEVKLHPPSADLITEDKATYFIPQGTENKISKRPVHHNTWHTNAHTPLELNVEVQSLQPTRSMGFFANFRRRTAIWGFSIGYRWGFVIFAFVAAASLLYLGANFGSSLYSYDSPSLDKPL